ncbi:MAG: hypothetical protein LBB65_05400, partial [Burkholderiales bacterium]|nr:hypothetical protein [Burkholderiales bacterium]
GIADVKLLKRKGANGDEIVAGVTRRTGGLDDNKPLVVDSPTGSGGSTGVPLKIEMRYINLNN